MSDSSSEDSIIEGSYLESDKNYPIQSTPFVSQRPGVISESDDSFVVAISSTPTLATNKIEDNTNWRETESTDEDSPITRRKYKPDVIVIEDDSDDESKSGGMVQISFDEGNEASSFESSSIKNNDTQSFDNSSFPQGSSFEDSSRRNLLMSRRKEKQLELLEASQRLNILKKTIKSVNISKLKDQGTKLKEKLNESELEVASISSEIEELDGTLDKLGLDESVQLIEPNENQSTQSGKVLWELPKANINLCDMGRKALKTHQTQQTLTMETLDNLHKSLKKCPGEEDEEDVLGLKVDLLTHQKQALAWLLWREAQKPSGGILADDMGLGKTLTMIALILKQKEINKGRKKPQSDSDDDSDIECRRKVVQGGTLVVAPASVMGQWEKEISSRVVRSLLYTVQHHGPKRDVKPHRLAVYDVVLTTYAILQKDNKENSQGPLLSMKWDRVILDEAHSIRNYKSQTAQAAFLLKAKHRWALTGTPVNNKELDFYSLLKFLRCHPFDDLMIWKKWVDNRDVAGMQRLSCITKSLLLRRTKEGILNKGGLKTLREKEFTTINVKLNEIEFSLYEKIAHLSQTLLGQLIYQRAEKEQILSGGIPNYKKQPIKGENPFENHPELAKLYNNMMTMGDVKTHTILVLILRLRQICCHPCLASAILDKEDLRAEAIEDEGVDMDVFDKLRNLSIRDQVKEEEDTATTKDFQILSSDNPIFNRNHLSSKIKAIIQCLKENILGTEDKAIIVSQWTSMLIVIGEFLDKEGIWYVSLNGTIAVKDRGAIVDKFNNEPFSQQVMLLSLTAGGVGLNLVGANHLLLVDVHWNPQLEAQACDRIYRVGQKKVVHIYKFVCTDTIEEHIVKLQAKKLDIADKILTGAKNISASSKLTLQDLKELFNMAI